MKSVYCERVRVVRFDTRYRVAKGIRNLVVSSDRIIPQTERIDPEQPKQAGSPLLVASAVPRLRLRPLRHSRLCRKQDTK